jgi:hypothetical protein
LAPEYHRDSLISIFAKTSCEVFIYAMEFVARSLSQVLNAAARHPENAQGAQVRVAALGALALLAGDSPDAALRIQPCGAKSATSDEVGQVGAAALGKLAVGAIARRDRLET